MLKIIKSFTTAGIRPVTITVECSVDDGIGIHLVGLADVAVKESLLRTVTALQANGYGIPGKRIIINLAPADLHKKGSGYDLPIALAVISASEQKNLPDLEQWVVAGELGLDGSVRTVPGAIQGALMAQDPSCKGLIIPAENAAEVAAQFSGENIYPVRSLKEAVDTIVDPASAKNLAEYIKENVKPVESSEEDEDALRWKSLIGNEAARRAVEIAAAGGHHVLLVGPPGSQKTTIARILLSLLPEMTKEETLETASIYSAAGRMIPVTGRPLRAPHCSASLSALLGGGFGGDVLPGEASLAHNGVLFLDDFPEFPKTSTEALRAPLEDRKITISRLKGKVDYPADFQLVAATMPCPCGYYGVDERCNCTKGQREAYLSRLSGPVYDRISIQVYTNIPVRGIPAAQNIEDFATVRERVAAARALQAERYKDEPYTLNETLDAKGLYKYCRLDADAQSLLEKLMEHLGLSARAYSRICRIARTIADLAGCETIQPAHLAEAASFRFLDRVNTLEDTKEK